MKKKVSILIVMVMLIVSCVSSTAFAKEANPDVKVEFSSIDSNNSTEEAISFNDVTIKSSKKAQGRSQGMLTDEVFAGTATLTPEDPAHVWIFDINSARYLLSRFTTSNPNYRMKLCVVNWDAGTITPLQAEYAPGQTVSVSFNQGSYAFYLYSVGDVGQSYDINYNYSAKKANGNPIYIANDLLNVIQNGGYAGIYRNGQLDDLNFPDKSPELVFSRSWTFNYPAGGYKKRKVDITDVTLSVSNILQKGKVFTYSSNYANSSAVVMLPIDENTLYSNWNSAYVNGGPLQIDKTDYRGLETPRRLDNDDILMGSNYLVYDLLTEKVIDLYGTLNSFYTTGHDEQPIVRQIS